MLRLRFVRNAALAASPLMLFAGLSGSYLLPLDHAAIQYSKAAPDDAIESGDCLIAMGEPSQLRQLEELAAARI